MIGGVDRRLAAVAAIYGGHFDRAEREHRAAACPANCIGRISPADTGHEIATPEHRAALVEWLRENI